MRRRALGDGALEDLLPPRRPRRKREDAAGGGETPAAGGGETPAAGGAGEAGGAGGAGGPASPAPSPSRAPEPKAELPREPAAPAEPRPEPSEEPAPPAKPRKRSRPQAPRGGKADEAPVRKRLSFDLAAPVADAARDVVFWTPGLTLTSLVEEALEAEIRRREKQRGKAFPPRTGDLSPGPPMR